MRSLFKKIDDNIEKISKVLTIFIIVFNLLILLLDYIYQFLDFRTIMMLILMIIIFIEILNYSIYYTMQIKNNMDIIDTHKDVINNCNMLLDVISIYYPTKEELVRELMDKFSDQNLTYEQSEQLLDKLIVYFKEQEKLI